MSRLKTTLSKLNYEAFVPCQWKDKTCISINEEKCTPRCPLFPWFNMDLKRSLKNLESFLNVTST